MKTGSRQDSTVLEEPLLRIMDALLDPDGPGNICEAVFLCAENLKTIADSLKDIQASLKMIALNSPSE
jgi:hypothetical protein